MTWATFYLVCFFVGSALSVIAFVFGGLHLTHFHFPHLHFVRWFHGHAALPDAHAPDAGSARGSLPVFNLGTITVFLAWFGATGYLLTEHSPLAALLILLFAAGAGTVGAAIIFWFVVKLLLAHDRELDPADYDRVGVLARIVSPVGAGGTGEIIFSQAGTRHTCGARSENGEALARGTEVVVTRYEHGIAYVRRWEEMAGGEAKARD
jgi:membrane protein implicated in regulation of membrane protease activity